MAKPASITTLETRRGFLRTASAGAMALAIGRLAPRLGAGESAGEGPRPAIPYTIVGTGQTRCYDNWHAIAPPAPGAPFYGQDAQHPNPRPAYRDNGDGTVTDLITGLMWVQARGRKVTWAAAVAGAAACRVGGHADWRMPAIKELYSLINFNGGFHGDPGGGRGMPRGEGMPPEKGMPGPFGPDRGRSRGAGDSIPYLDAKVFGFAFGDVAAGERPIDCQDWSATQYVGTTMNGNPTVFGVNFADGRIKGYPKTRPGGGPGGPGPGGMGPGGRQEHTLYVRYVRGNPSYGKNDFVDNGDGTITDRATGLVWSKADSGKGMNWEAALAWVQAKNAARYLGHADWRLPNAKELQSTVDYTRAPAVTHSPAIDPLFETSRLPDGEYPFFWTNTTHLDGPPDRQGNAAVYVAFGRALGWMQFPPGRGPYRLLDVHGAGAQRSDPKTGDPAAFPHGRGPQGDVIRIANHVRPVRGGV